MNSQKLCLLYKSCTKYMSIFCMDSGGTQDPFLVEKLQVVYRKDSRSLAGEAVGCGDSRNRETKQYVCISP